MCEAILAGLLKTGHPTDRVMVSEPFDKRREYLTAQYGCPVVEDNNQVVKQAEVVVLAVKPQVVGEVVRGVAESLRAAKPLVISIVAGVAIRDFARWINLPDQEGSGVPLVRLMPNTPALVGEGAAGMYAEAQVSKVQREQTEYVVKNIAREYFWVDAEAGVDDVCAVSGSGPAYFFLIIEAMEKKGQELGLSREAARRLAAQTCLGAAKMVLDGEDDAGTLRSKVTSPNGTTHAAIQSMIANNLPEIIGEGMQACRDRCKSLSEEFGKL